MNLSRKTNKYLFYSINIIACLILAVNTIITIPSVNADDSEGWYRDGSPIIETVPYKDDACYFGKKLTLGDGSASGTMSWTDVNCVAGSSCSGTYTGITTWTSPPSYMKPGSTITFNLSSKTSAQNSCGYKNIGSHGWITINGKSIAEVIDTRKPTATGTYTVASGSAGAKLTIVATAKAANLSGTVTYNYIYKGSGSASPTTTSQAGRDAPTAGQAPGPITDSLPVPQGEEPLGFVTSDASGPIYVSAGPWEMPPSQQKWIIIKGRQPLYKGWIIRTSSGAEAKLIFSSGALTRIKQNSWFEIMPFKPASTPQSVVYGRLFNGIANFYFEKQKEGSKKFEVETERAIVGIKGTNFVLETTESITLLKVIEGTVEYTSKQSGQSTMVEAGEKIEASSSGLEKKSTFNAATEKASWGDMTLPGSDSSGNTQSNSSTGKKQGISLPKCPVTTALEVDPSSPRLTIFRNFRDKVLSRSEAGRVFIDLYYLTGTWVVENILCTGAVRRIARQAVLVPVSLALADSAPIWDKE